MPIQSIKSGSLSRSLAVGNAIILPGDFESIATVSVTGASTSSITFSAIPQTFTHLQIRLIGGMSASGPDDCRIQFNSDTGNNYAWHYFYGNGVTAGANGTSSSGDGLVGANTLPTATSTFGVSVIDLFDYANTNKYKTMRALAGYDANGSGYASMSSVLWQNTNAISSIKLYPAVSSFKQYSHFALYGVN